MNYPNWRKGIKWGVLAGIIAALLWLGGAVLFSELDAPTDVSLSRAKWAFKMHWPVAIFCFLFVAFWFGFLAALRPEIPTKRSE